MSWSKYCVVSQTSRVHAVAANPAVNPPTAIRSDTKTTGATLQINSIKPEKRAQPKNNNLDYMIDRTFRNINRLFVLSFKNGNNDPTRDSFDKFTCHQ